jgi:hypothetical protein
MPTFTKIGPRVIKVGTLLQKKNIHIDFFVQVHVHGLYSAIHGPIKITGNR